MAFGARQEDGKWRLCHRKGRTIVHWTKKFWPEVEIVFASQSKAKACADALNERWKEYETVEFAIKRRPPVDVQAMVDFFFETIVDHGGLSDEAQKVLTSESRKA